MNEINEWQVPDSDYQTVPRYELKLVDPPEEYEFYQEAADDDHFFFGNPN